MSDPEAKSCLGWHEACVAARWDRGVCVLSGCVRFTYKTITQISPATYWLMPKKQFLSRIRMSKRESERVSVYVCVLTDDVCGPDEGRRVPVPTGSESSFQISNSCCFLADFLRGTNWNGLCSTQDTSYIFFSSFLFWSDGALLEPLVPKSYICFGLQTLFIIHLSAHQQCC